MSDMSYSTKEENMFMNVQGGEKKVMKKILSVALSTAMAFSMFANVAFGDTATLTPQAKFDALAAKGILNGYPDGQAHLEKDLTRAEFAKIVTKLFDLKEVSNKLSYKDKGYNAKNWAVPYIEAVTAAGYMQGQDTVKGIFNYNGKVTVEEVAAVLFRALKLETPATSDNTASAWAKGYAQAVINAGLVAKDTNFKANASRSLVVETAYAVDQLKAAPTVASAEAVSPTSVVVTFSDKTTETVTLTTALEQGKETTISFKHNGHDYTAKVTLAAPKVVSVTTPNSKQVVVKFNRPVDASTLTETTAGVTTLVYGAVSMVNLGSAPAVSPEKATVVLAADGTEAWLTFADNQYLKGQYTFTLNDKTKTTAGEKIAPYTQLLTVADTTAPTIVSVSAVAKATTNKVQVKLSEPVKGTGTVIAYVNGVAANVENRKAGAALDELTLSTGTLESGKTYDVSLTNIVDFAGNYIAPNPTKTTVTVVSDVTAPTVSKVTVTGENTVEVVFSKKMDIQTLHGNISLLNSNGENKGTFQVSQGKDATTFNLTHYGVTFPASDSFNGTIVFGATIRDYLGNTVAASSTQAVSFAKDTVAPTVVSATYGTSGLTVKLSEKVTFVSTGQIALINDATGYPTIVTVTPTTTDGKEFKFAVPTLSTGNYSLRLPAGAFIDSSIAKNKLAAVVVPVTVAADNTVDTEKPFVVAGTTSVVADVYGQQTISFKVQDLSGLNISTLKEVANYTLDGKALPSGTYITTDYVSGSTTVPVKVSIVVPSSGISKSDKLNLVVNGIADTSGNVIVPDTLTVSLKDGVSPTLANAAVSSGDGKLLVLGFSEDITNISADGSDFVFNVNGIEVPAGAVKVTTTPGVGSDAGKYYVTIEAKSGKYNDQNVLFFDLGKTPDGIVQHNEVIAYTDDAAGAIKLSSNYIYSVTVKVADGSAIKDKSNNVISNGNVIPAK